MDWKTYGNYFEFDNCFSLNFGYHDMKLSIPQIHNIPKSRMKLSFDSPSSCIFVIVGGKYLSKIGDVMEKVDSVRDDLGGIRPLAVFLNSNNYQEDIIIDVDNSFKRYKSTPVMVKIFLIRDKQMTLL